VVESLSMKNGSWFLYFLIAAMVIMLGSLGYGYYRYDLLTKEYSEIRQTLEESLARSEQENAELANALRNEREVNASFSSQINEIASTVGILDKLARTDPELLQKYSKVYFLSEHYIPESLSLIDSVYTHNRNEDLKIHTAVRSFLEKLMQESINDGLTLKVISAYRSFGQQGAIKTGYTFSYGGGANRFSADQGYSEHQLGTTIDFTTEKTGANFSQFDETEESAWLLENAYRFGFTLSYPENNSFYQFEPWHWRFVGIALATELYDRNLNFYDLEQREINEYLVSIFD